VLDRFHDLSPSLKHWGDAVSITALLASLAHWLPSVASLLTIIWTALRIYEMPIVQRWLGLTPPSDPPAPGAPKP